MSSFLEVSTYTRGCGVRSRRDCRGWPCSSLVRQADEREDSVGEKETPELELEEWELQREWDEMAVRGRADPCLGISAKTGMVQVGAPTSRTRYRSRRAALPGTCARRHVGEGKVARSGAAEGVVEGSGPDDSRSRPRVRRRGVEGAQRRDDTMDAERERSRRQMTRRGSLNGRCTGDAVSGGGACGAEMRARMRRGRGTGRMERGCREGEGEETQGDSGMKQNGGNAAWPTSPPPPGTLKIKALILPAFERNGSAGKGQQLASIGVNRPVRRLMTARRSPLSARRSSRQILRFIRPTAQPKLEIRALLARRQAFKREGPGLLYITSRIPASKWHAYIQGQIQITEFLDALEPWTGPTK
ncbi:hypothetical protein B0H11DRAFT_1902817 [Mycena galericulata]|nr:hypothetical protein B0H11DRAFT_1902817 [Mycena galericulata]